MYYTIQKYSKPFHERADKLWSTRNLVNGCSISTNMYLHVPSAIPGILSRVHIITLLLIRDTSGPSSWQRGSPSDDSSTGRGWLWPPYLEFSSSEPSTPSQDGSEEPHAYARAHICTENDGRSFRLVDQGAARGPETVALASSLSPKIPWHRPNFFFLSTYLIPFPNHRQCSIDLLLVVFTSFIVKESNGQ